MADKILLAGCVIVDDYGRILLLHRSTDELSHWELPGGKVEQNELPESAAVRELAEELGIKVRLTKALGSGEFEDEQYEYIYHWFQAAIVSGEPQLMEPEKFDDFEYIELDDMMELALSANMLELLPKIVNGEVALHTPSDV